MRRVVTSLTALVFGFFVTVAAIALRERAGSEDRDELGRLGQPELAQFCELEHGAGVTAMLDGTTSNSWKCRSIEVDGGTDADIDLDQACEQLFATTAYAHTDDVDDPFSLRCYAGERP